jgi:hypothetical protein
VACGLWPSARDGRPFFLVVWETAQASLARVTNNYPSNRLTSQPEARSAHPRNPRIAWLVAIVLGLIFLAASPFAMNPDGISYLHLADLFASGNWRAAVDACWSPLYPVMLAVFTRFAPSAYWEAPAVHAANFVCYLLAFASFRYFLKSLADAQATRSDGKMQAIDFRRPAENIAAHVLFFFTALTWIGLKLVTPDMLVACLLYLATGLAIRLHDERTPSKFAWLGAVAGAGYLAKAVMFPLGIVFLIVAAFTPRNWTSTAKRAAFAFAGFLVVAAPQVIAVSRIAGHLTYADTGQMVFAREIDRYPMFWTGAPKGSGTPVHPVRTIHSKPDAFEFATPDKHSSYPFWDRPAYWTAGIRSHSNLARQLEVTLPIVKMYGELFATMIFGALVLVFSAEKRFSLRFLALVIPSLAALAAYALVFAEPRYLGPWAVVLFIGIIATLRFSTERMDLARAVLAAMTIVLGAPLISQTIAAYNASDEYMFGEMSANPQLEIAAKLRSLGVGEGSRVASVGYAFNDYWAHLGGIQVAMQTPEPADYWKASDSVKDAVNETFRRAGAVAIVTSRPPADGPGSKWISLGIAHYYVLPLATRSLASK